MKVNFDAPMLDLAGNPFFDTSTPEKKPVTLGIVCLTALVSNDNVDAAEKVKRFKLAVEVTKGGEQYLPLDDVTYIKSLVGRMIPSPVVVGRVFELLEG